MAHRYLGNKTRLTPWLLEIISQYVSSGSVIADPMCGTASASLAFSEAGFNVRASDLLRCSYIFANSRLLFSSEASFANFGMSYADALHQLNTIEPKFGYFSKEFGESGSPANGRAPRRYFTATNAGRIDAIRLQIKEWREQGLDSLHCDVLLNDLMLAVNQVANISGTYGYFRNGFSSNSLRSLQLQSSPLVEKRDHEVRHGSLNEILPSLEVDLVYLDPPYTKRQYAANYHILETIALEDEPVAQGDGGLRPWQNQSSNFCYRRKAPSAVIQAMENLTSSFAVWSYSADGQISIENFVDILTTFGQVDVFATEIDRYRSNSRGPSGVVTEYVLVCTIK